MDALLGGGLSRGTCTLFLGPAGVGKTSFAVPVHLGRGGDDALCHLSRSMSVVPLCLARARSSA